MTETRFGGPLPSLLLGYNDTFAALLARVF